MGFGVDTTPYTATDKPYRASDVLLHDLPNRSAHPARALTAHRDGGIRLAVEGLVENNMTPRPHLPLHGQPTGLNLPGARTLSAEKTLTATVGPLPALTLDPLTAIDNPTYYDTLHAEINLPQKIKDGLHWPGYADDVGVRRGDVPPTWVLTCAGIVVACFRTSSTSVKPPRQKARQRTTTRTGGKVQGLTRVDGAGTLGLIAAP